MLLPKSIRNDLVPYHRRPSRVLERAWSTTERVDLENYTDRYVQTWVLHTHSV